MACPSGRLLADLFVGRQPEIDVEGLFMDRYSKCSRQVDISRVARA
jgi:D-amino-acid dehydrogenase